MKEERRKKYDRRKSRNVLLRWAVGSLIITVIIFILIILIRSVREDRAPLPLRLGNLPDKLPSSGKGTTRFQMKNTFFRLTEKIVMSVPEMSGEIIPLKEDIIYFDDVNQFAIDLDQGRAEVPYPVIDVLLNEILFAYPDARIRNLRSGYMGTEDGRHILKMTGELKLVVYIPFEMTSYLGYDTRENVLVLTSRSIRSLGNPYTRSILSMVGLNLEELVSVPPGRPIRFKGNQIFVDPFDVFPPPRLGGYVSLVSASANGMEFRFQNPRKVNQNLVTEEYSGNYLKLSGGILRFGKLSLHGGEMLIRDSDNEDPFDFYLRNYHDSLTRGSARVRPDGSLIVSFPDYGDISTGKP